MEKVINFFKNILLAIVYPNRLLTLFRVKNLDQNSNRILGNDTVLRSLAFIGAVVFVIGNRYTPRTTPTTHSETVTLSLTRTIDAENYTYFGSPIPSTIDIILSGDRTAVELFVASNELAANLNLQGLEPGNHNGVVVDITGVPPGINATPSIGIINNIIIDVVVTESFRVMPTERLPGLSSRFMYGAVTVYPEYVTITGPQRLINDINEVQVFFDILGEQIDAPRIIERDLLVVPQNVTGISITSGLYFHQQIVQVRVAVYENMQTMPIRYQNPTNIPTGYRVEVTMNITEIDVWGDFNRLSNVITLQRFSFDDLDEDGRVTVPIILPPGVYSETHEVELIVTYEEIAEASSIFDIEQN